MSDDSNVRALPVKKREPVDENAFLQSVPVSTCRHYGGPFEVDIDGAKCKCKACGGDVSPIFVLEQLMLDESRWNRTRKAYVDEMRRLGERSSTKCQHCKQMTRISQR